MRTHLRHAIIRTLLIVVSIGMGFTLFRIWQVKQEVDEIATKLTLEYGPKTTLIYDSKDQVIAALYKEHRMPVSLEEMSEPLIQAVLAAEDRRFYEHNGIDVRRIGSAMVANLRRGRIVQGASTITQQVVRGAVLDRTKTYGRKLREAWLSHRLEEKFGKQEILQAYLNHIYFGEGNYGVQAAALGYFGKPASELNAAEGATLASLINRPQAGRSARTRQRSAIAAIGCCARCIRPATSMRRRSARRSQPRWPPRCRSSATARARSGQRRNRALLREHHPRHPLRTVRRRPCLDRRPARLHHARFRRAAVRRGIGSQASRRVGQEYNGRAARSRPRWWPLNPRRVTCARWSAAATMPRALQPRD